MTPEQIAERLKQLREGIDNGSPVLGFADLRAIIHDLIVLFEALTARQRVLEEAQSAVRRK